MGSGSSASGQLFVVQKHAARHLHYDLRLEMDGVLKSWAVPKGPSYDMSEKRLAVHVEDHPLDYADFEGVIPTGNYGAGGMIVWDRGEWVPLEDWREGLVKGKLLFELRGIKLHGRWTLVKIKKSEKDWLLIKERDAYVASPGNQFAETSVLSGLTVEEIKEGRSPAAALRSALERTDALRAQVDPRMVDVMLAEPASEAFTRDDWVFELKMDGYRLLASKVRGDVLLLTRNGNDYTAVFPEVVRALKALPLDDFIIDGEVVVLDQQGRPSFSLLQRRGRLSSPIEIRHATVELAATFYAFDFIGYESFDLRPLPLVERKALLLEAFPKFGVVRTLDHISREGERFLEEVDALGLEGIIAKKADAPYRGGRSDKWLKMKADRTDDFVIVGFTAPKRSRGYLGALQLADVVDGQLVYAGRAGTGFDEKTLAEVAALLAPIVRDDPPCLGPVVSPESAPLAARAIPETKTTTWVDPVHVCEVRFREWTPDGLLRHPAFIRLRTDKAPMDCDRQGFGGEQAVDSEKQVLHSVQDDNKEKQVFPLEPAQDDRQVPFSNLGKTYWPADGFTKGDLIDYYRAVAPWMLPYLRARPMVLTRFPDGIEGKSSWAGSRGKTCFSLLSS